MINKASYYFIEFFAELKMLSSGIKYLFSEKKKALYVGCTRMGNLGDEAIFQAIRETLLDNIFLYEIPYNKPSSGRRFRKLFFKSPDYIILGGGTIIRKGKGESYLRILNNLKFEWPKAKIIVLGPGVVNPNFANYIGFPIDKEEWKDLLIKSKFISVRGILSKTELDSWGLERNVKIFHDPAIFYARQVVKKKNREKRIGLNFADIGNRIYGKNKRVIELFVLEIVEKLLSNGWNVYLFPTTKSDLDYMMNDIGLKKYKKIGIYKNYQKLNDSLNFLESLDVFLGQRLHSIIFSCNVYTPFHALEYEPKTSDFLTTLGLEKNMTRVDELDVNVIFDIVTKLYNRLEEEQQLLFDKINLAKKEQQQCCDDLSKI